MIDRQKMTESVRRRLRIIYLMRRKSHLVALPSTPTPKYSLPDASLPLHLSNSLDSQLGSHRARPAPLSTPQRKIKSNASFALESILKDKTHGSLVKRPGKSSPKSIKLPSLTRSNIENPQHSSSTVVTKNCTGHYYLGRVARSFQTRDVSYLVALSRQHFAQTLQALKTGRGIKVSKPGREIKLHKKNPKHKTVYLDLDETLIHCDENSSNYTVKLNFPIEGGGTIAAGVRVRPHCLEFIRQLSTFAEIIIFTASSASYADVVLNYLDPQRRYFSHRLYRQHCTLERGFFTKDLRSVNRRLEDSVLVDNSGYSFMLLPENGIPILPYYHFNKDKQLPHLLLFLKQLLGEEDVRSKLKSYFFWDKFNAKDTNSKQVFQEHYQFI